MYEALFDGGEMWRRKGDEGEAVNRAVDGLASEAGGFPE